MEKIRIQKIMSDSGVCSRRKAEEYISEGRVKVNGRPCKLGDKALAGKDIITLDGCMISLAKFPSFVKSNSPSEFLSSLPIG